MRDKNMTENVPIVFVTGRSYSFLKEGGGVEVLKINVKENGDMFYAELC